MITSTLFLSNCLKTRFELMKHGKTTFTAYKTTMFEFT